MADREPPGHLSTACTCGSHDACTEDRAPSRPQQGVVYLVCVCACHRLFAVREQNMAAYERADG